MSYTSIVIKKNTNNKKYCIHQNIGSFRSKQNYHLFQPTRNTEPIQFTGNKTNWFVFSSKNSKTNHLSQKTIIL